MSQFHNPILTGFYPDPSIVRVEEDYYLVCSSFEYFPALPLFHSRDLVHWRQIGHVVDRPSQLNLAGVRPSGGLYAPTLRYHDGVFYVINTLVDGKGKSGNFIMTTTEPAGAWSDPYWLDDAEGIDPSLFFDDDGRVWYCGTRQPLTGVDFVGHCEVWLRELDIKTMKLIGETFVLWDGAMKQARYPEAPHIYKINGYYYLLIAEGGTEEYHAITVARSKAITGQYEPCPHNPILTHRHMGLNSPITGTGHADLVQTQNGEWWAVLLAMRPYGGYYYNLGRETFLAPVTWENDWFFISAQTGRLESQYPRPNLPDSPVLALPACDNFESDTLAYHWNLLRTGLEPFYSLKERFSYLRLYLRPEQITEWVQPSFIGRRQQAKNFTVRAALEFEPANDAECAGLVVLHSSDVQFRFVCTLVDGQKVVQVIKRDNRQDFLRAERLVSAKRLYFMIRAIGQDYHFAIAESAEAWQTLSIEDGRILSPQLGDFVGTYLGMYASSQGEVSHNHADWDYFEYLGREQD